MPVRILGGKPNTSSVYRYPQRGLKLRLAKSPTNPKGYVGGQGGFSAKLRLLWDAPTPGTHDRARTLKSLDAYKSSGRFVSGSGADPVFEIV